ncbi:MAG: hypothetical protein DCC65_10250 [Planctomycetota bacterium]|nr:MAG: hypothetical protein DCC65_10250 [Planctomycetota bacterium]
MPTSETSRSYLRAHLGVPLFTGLLVWSIWQGGRVMLSPNPATDWIATTATIKKVEFSEQSSRRGIRKTLKCKYTYQVGERSHDGTRIAIVLGDDQWKDHWGFVLKTAFESGQSVPCFVNPHDFSEAVLDPAVPRGTTRNLIVLLVLSACYLIGYSILVVPRVLRNWSALAGSVGSGSGSSSRLGGS